MPQSHNCIDTIRADAPALAAYGPHAIGVRTLRLTHPAQVDLLQIDPGAACPDPLPRRDRSLAVEVWYPAQAGSTGNTVLRALVRDGQTEVDLQGRAVRDAVPASTGPFPLVIVSHGFPGNRFLLSPLAENIASKGYVVASVEHADSTYQDFAHPLAFASAMLNRPLDQLFVLDALALQAADEGSFLHGLLDADRTALIGYSMGAYGALISAGGGVSSQAVDSREAPVDVPHGLLGVHRAGSQAHLRRFDPRVKTVVTFAPWGSVRGVFDAQTLQGVRVPVLFVAGSADDISGYEDGVRASWQMATGVDRALLTFERAGHNVGALMPAPVEAQAVDPLTGATMANHYLDAVWDTVRMNNVSQHFVTAWLGRHLQSDAAMDAFLDLVPVSDEGVWSVDEQGQTLPDHTSWKGFARHTARGLRLEHLKAGH